MSANRETARSADPPTTRWALGLGALLLPLVVVGLSPAFADSTLVYLGVLPAVVALPCGPRVVWLSAAATGIVIFLGLALGTNPWASAVLFAVLGIVVARSYAYGWQSAATFVTTVGAVAAIATPTSALVTSVPPSSVIAAATAAGIAAGGGVWVAVIGSIALYDLPRRPPDPLEHGEFVAYAAVLALALGLGAFVAVAFAPGSSAWSVLLTVLLVVTPRHRQTRTRAMQRAVGTVLGGAVAAIFVLSISQSVALHVVGLLAALASVVARLRGPYLGFCAALTLALVLLTMPADQALRGDAERVILTVIVTGVIVIISAVVNQAYDRLTRSTAKPT